RMRIQGILDRLPDGMGELSAALASRLRADSDAMAITILDQQNAQRFARKLLHRMSQSLALALLCEMAGDAHRQGNFLPAHSAWRFYEDIEPPALGTENEAARRGVMEILTEEVALDARVQ
ncbi:MAG TPA: hypothetical protein VII23_20045, partial [Terriglobales bacterium]